MVLRHEVLHRSMFHGFGERFENDLLANLVLDVFINRLLADAYPIEFPRACSEIYPPESKNTPVALADCTATPEALPLKLRELWNLLWRPDTPAVASGLTPPSLYYRLIRLGAVDLRWNPFGSPEDGGDLYPYPSAPMATAAGKVLDDIGARIPASTSRLGTLAEYTVLPARVSASSIEGFLRRLKLRRIADELARKVTEPFRTGVRIQPYPMFPTRLGLAYRMLGLSELYTLYWNRETAYTGSRLAIAIYLDVSGSMVKHFPLVCSIADALSDYPLRLKVFDDSLRAAEVEDLAAGRIRGGGGTNFDLPLHDLACDPEVMAGLLCTDGEGDVSPATAGELQRSRKRLYLALFGGQEQASAGAALRRHAAETIVVRGPAL
jgi:hypothetical protein